jgi:hypothetical protein
MTDTTRDIVLRLEGKVDNIVGQMENLANCVNGNGKPGLKTDVVRLQGEIDTIKKDKDTKGARSWTIILLVVGQVLTLLVSFLKS